MNGNGKYEKASDIGDKPVYASVVLADEKLYAAAKETPLGTVGGPIRSRGKYSVIWPVRWTDETYQDFLMVKEDIAATLTDEERERAIREWLLERRQSVDINIYDDVIWNMIDKDFYASTGSASSEP